MVPAQPRQEKERTEGTGNHSTGSAAALEAANLQGLGNRTEQQDAFGVSPLERYESDGLLAVLCDGMGGMAEEGGSRRKPWKSCWARFRR